MASELTIRADRADSPASLELLEEFYAVIAGLYPGWEPTTGATAAPHEVAPPEGAWLLGELGGEPIACGGLKRLDPVTVEVKRLYVRPQARGKGVARELLSALEDEAARLGCERVRLDTGAHQPDALHLFRSAGYAHIEDYNGNPFASHWLEKRLG